MADLFLNQGDGTPVPLEFWYYPSVPQIQVIGAVAERADVKRRVTIPNIASQSSQPRVVDAPGPEKASIGGWYELQRVALPYAHRVKDVGREGDLTLSGDPDKHVVLLGSYEDSIAVRV